MADIIFSSLIGGASFVIGILSAVKLMGKNEQRVDDRITSLEKVSHATPCAVVGAIKDSIARIETNIEWLKEQARSE